MRYWTIRITEIVVLDKGEQEIETFILMDAETEVELAKLIAMYILELKEDNIYADDVDEVYVGSKEMTKEDWLVCGKYINTYVRGSKVGSEDHEAKVDPSIIISDTIQ